MSEQGVPRVVVVLGPTATGKGALARQLARAFGGEIISADSMKVYRGLDIGTAKPTAAERQAVPHHLLDICELTETFSAGAFREAASRLVRELWAAGKLPIVVGGTGLYIKALTRGLVAAPSRDPGVRAALDHEIAARGPAQLHARLARVDPESAARLHPADAVRIVRALEVHALTGRPLSALHAQHRFTEAPFRVLKLGLTVPRAELDARINARAERMVAQGLCSEVATLLDQGHAPTLAPLLAPGYREMVAHLRGQLGLDEALRRMQQRTRAFAKRQLTWFRPDLETRWLPASAPDAAPGAVAEFLRRA
ncbi:MAG: tRNA (adenosine(37)-N6)-dimethylallyltransferase MiaA [Deltaproteobacteria bacterium]|nr:tRNA (adenosine(37)-N6)-dimethylallyltransferase MiaA [Deltaproteobacteria bacterium]